MHVQMWDNFKARAALKTHHDIYLSVDDWALFATAETSGAIMRVRRGDGTHFRRSQMHLPVDHHITSQRNRHPRCLVLRPHYWGLNAYYSAAASASRSPRGTVGEVSF
jgi:hypothetical protein